MRSSTKSIAVIISVLLVGSASHDVTAGEPEARQVIVIPAHNGKVLWKDVLREVAAQSGVEIDAQIPGSTGIDLNSTSARWTISGMNLLLSPELKLRLSEDQSSLLVEVNLDSIKKQKERLGKKLRQVTSFADDLGFELGLACEPGAMQAKRAVILIHGFGSSPSALQHLQDRLAADGRATCTFGYRSRHGVEESARRFSEALRQMQIQNPAAKVSLVAHSMGSIVSRWMVEHADLYPACVDQLIMIAPPNHGTDWTQPGLNGPPLQGANVKFDPAPLGALAGGVAEEFHLGIRDLRPESKVLTQLNQLDRNPDVSYSLILGHQGAVDPAFFLIPQNALITHQQSQLAAMALNQLIYLQYQLGDEMIEGQGDGVVSLASGLLEGVSDVTIIEMRHNDIQRPRKPAFESLVEAVTRRLAD